ncbi:MAG TPA: hypothetical protein VGL29_01240 [Blastocatellia bacterium]|jgi:hypothetical protein
MRKVISPGRFVVLASVFSALLLGPSLFDVSGANPYQSRNTHYGVSGGNVNDISRAFCCSGTLGSLVQDSNLVQYVLSNNHVLARTDQASPGEDISQPGLVDTSCRPATTVADFTSAVPLGNNVDAALAQVVTGQMDPSGFIEGIGLISSVVKAPSVGLAVEKSGRTTGTTTDTISSVNTSVSVQYQRGCNQGKKFVVSYTNQVVINSTTFSAGGDSGSLIVTNNACAQPVALLFAGSSSTTIGNPIGEVLSKLSPAVSFVGSVCSASTSEQPVSDGQTAPSIESVARATKAMRTQEADLMSRPGIIGVGVGASDTGSTDAAIVVYIDVNSPVSAKVAKKINGVRVRKVFTEPFVAY